MKMKNRKLTDEAYLFYSFNEENGNDSGPYGLHAQCMGKARFGEKSAEEVGPSGKFLFVEKENYYRVPIRGLHLGNKAFSVTMWVRFPEDTSETDEIILMRTGMYTAGSPGFLISVKKTDRNSRFTVGIGDEFSERNSISELFVQKNIFDGKWHLISAVFDQPNCKYTLSIDAEDTVSVDIYEKDLWASGTAVSYMGLGIFVREGTVSETASVQEYGGLAVDDIAIYKKALSDEEIREYFRDPSPCAEKRETSDHVHNGTYYVDSVNGKDTNDGLTPEKAFRTVERVNMLYLAPGAEVLFKKGCVFKGKLVLTAKGSEDRPILISSYGSGECMPVLAGEGVLPGTVHLLNCEYITVSGIEVTNSSDVPERRSGFYIEAKNSGILRGITVSECCIHDIIGDNYNSNFGFYRLTGAIICYPNGLEVPSAFNGLKIENNKIYYADHSGILLYSTWCNRDGIGEGYGKRTPSENVTVRGNNLNDIGGDGIQIGTSNGTVAEHNVVYYANNRSGKYRVGLWPWNSDNCIYQYNEVAFTGCVEGDGQGYDIDFGTNNNVMQYNYSHDNKGGFLLVCSYPGVKNINSIFRYNLSINDDGIIYRVVGIGTSGCKIYNNFAYNDKIESVFWLLTTADFEKDVSEVYFYNNIFYSTKGAHWSINDKTYLRDNYFHIGNNSGSCKNQTALNDRQICERTYDLKVGELIQNILSSDTLNFEDLNGIFEKLKSFDK